MSELKSKANDAIRTRQSQLKNIIVVSGAQDVIRACDQRTLISAAIKDNLVDNWIGKGESDRVYSLLDAVRKSFAFKTSLQLDRFVCVLYEICGDGGKEASLAIAREYGIDHLKEFKKLSSGLVNNIPQEGLVNNIIVPQEEPDEGEIMDTSENGVNSSSQGKTTDHLQLDGNSPVFKYPCQSGMVVIIANENFKGSDCREGTDTDIEKIKKTFAKNNPGVFKDLSADQMKDYFETQLCDTLNKGFVRPQPDYLICFIMSHGNENGIQGVDRNHVTIAELAKTLEADKCTALKGKPKLFFIQACRGNSSPDAVRFDNARGEQPEDKIVFDGNITAIPPGADFLFSYSTVPNNLSLRREQSGSFYIQILCSMIDKYSPKLSLHDIVMLVHQELATNDKYVFEDKKAGIKYRQMAEMVSTLRGHVHLK